VLLLAHPLAALFDQRAHGGGQDSWQGTLPVKRGPEPKARNRVGHVQGGGRRWIIA
jgi:hypothetical protein